MIFWIGIILAWLFIGTLVVAACVYFEIGGSAKDDADCVFTLLAWPIAAAILIVVLLGRLGKSIGDEL